MRWFRNLPIKWKLVWIIMASTTAALVVAAGAGAVFQWTQLRTRWVQQLDAQTRMIADNCAAALAFGDAEAAREVLRAWRAEPNTVNATVRDGHGRVFASFEQGRAVELPAVMTGPVFQNGLLVMQREVVFGDHAVGTLTVALSLAEYRRRMWVFAAIAVSTSLAALLVALVVAQRLQRVFTGPLSALAGGAAAVTERGDYTVRVVPESEDELGQLTGAFNEMLAQIQRRDEAVRSAEERLRLLVEHLPVITYTAEPTPLGRWFYVSPQVERLFGFTPAEWTGTPGLWLNRVHPDDRARVIAADEQCRETGVFSADYRVVARDGRLVWCHDEGTLQPGQPSLLQGIILDVSERQRMVEALRESEERLQSIIDNSTAVIYLKDRAGRYVLINRSFEELFDVTRATVVGKTDYDMFPHNLAEVFRANDLRVLAEARPIQFDEVTPHRDGPHAYLSLKFPIINHGRVEAVCGISTDVTARRRLERQVLEVSDREQARIGQDLHDGLCQHLVSTHFACLRLAQKLTGAEAAQAGELAQLLEVAVTQSRQIARGLYPVRLKAEGLAVALHELAGTVRKLHGVSCQVDIPVEPKCADTATAIHLYRIGQEAVSNALKHSKAANLVISYRLDNNRATLAVSDDGVGFVVESVPPGGLGLHIMKYRAALIGGTLDVTNAPEGGTIVRCQYATGG